MKINYHIDDFISYCMEKGLSKRTYGSYEKTLILFSKYMLETWGIDEIEEITRKHVREYIEYIRNRGKYTVVADKKKKFL